MSSFAKGFIFSMLSLCIAMSAAGCAPSEQNSSLIGSIYKNGRYDFRGIAQHSTLNEVLEREGLSMDDVTPIEGNPSYYKRNEKLQINGIGSPCMVLYVFTDEKCNDFLGGIYKFETEDIETHLSLIEELQPIIKTLPDPSIGKIESLQDKKTNFNVMWDGKDRTRLRVSADKYAGINRYFIDITVSTLYAQSRVPNHDEIIN